MAKKKRKGAARTQKRAAPRPTVKPIDPKDPKVAEAGQEIGRVLGKGLAAIGKNFAQKAKDSPGLNRNAEMSAKVIVPDEKTLDVRMPDSQTITWGRKPEDPSRQMGWYEDPLMQSEPISAEWVWYPFDGEGTKVTVNKSFGVTGAYIVTLSIDVAANPIEFLRGSGKNAKKVAEALLSASDWEGSWRAVMGPDVTQEVWRNYERKI